MNIKRSLVLKPTRQYRDGETKIVFEISFTLKVEIFTEESLHVQNLPIKILNFYTIYWLTDVFITRGEKRLESSRQGSL